MCLVPGLEFLVEVSEGNSEIVEMCLSYIQLLPTPPASPWLLMRRLRELLDLDAGLRLGSRSVEVGHVHEEIRRGGTGAGQRIIAR